MIRNLDNYLTTSSVYDRETSIKQKWPTIWEWLNYGI